MKRGEELIHRIAGRRSRLKLLQSLILLLLLFSKAPWISGQSRSYVAPLIHSPYNLLFVKVLVNGHEALALVDTGSFQILQLSSSLATRLQMDMAPSDTSQTRHAGNASKVRVAKLNELRIEQYVTRDLRVGVVEGDIERISQVVGTKFDAIIGWGFLSQFAFTINYQDKVLHFGMEAPTPDRPADWTFRFEEVRKVPVVPGSIAGNNVSFLFDTGAPQTSIDRELISDPVGNLLRKRLIIGGYSEEVEFRVKDLSRIRDTLGCAAVLGNNLFVERVLSVNPSKRIISVWLKRP